MRKLIVLQWLTDMFIPFRTERIFSLDNILLLYLPLIIVLVICLRGERKKALIWTLATLAVYIVCEFGTTVICGGQTVGLVFLVPGIIALGGFGGSAIALLIKALKKKY